jgi:glycine cleavage system H protein
MSELRYSRDHEWVRAEGGDIVTVGITDYAQRQLGDVVYVELPAVGAAVERDRPAAVVESVKAASEVMSPVSGTVTEVNGALADEPQRINESPTGDGWFFRVKVSAAGAIEGLLTEAAYDEFVKTLG